LRKAVKICRLPPVSDLPPFSAPFFPGDTPEPRLRVRLERVQAEFSRPKTESRSAAEAHRVLKVHALAAGMAKKAAHDADRSDHLHPAFRERRQETAAVGLCDDAAVEDDDMSSVRARTDQPPHALTEF
jgi:hypothetical protein